MRRHASADELASLAEGELRPRKAARVSAHLQHCDQCTNVSQELEGVSVLLASASYESMPDGVSAHIEAAIATESRQRLATEPATEAGRGELPARARRARRTGWQLPLVSSPLALRVAAATGAAVIVVGGAYELANHGLGASSGPSTPTASAGRAAVGAAPAIGPQVLFLGPKDHEQTFRTVQTRTDFEPGQLQGQVDAAMNQASSSSEGFGVASNAPAASGVQGAVSTPAAGGPAAGATLPGQTATDQRLAACIDRVTANQVPEWVDTAKYQGQPATIIVVAARGSVPAQVWVVGSNCSAAKSDVLDHQVLKHV